MLLAVEGGVSFVIFCFGLYTVQLLRKKPEERPMRVAPWNQYQLVDRETNPRRHLASTKNRLIPGCTSFLCFGRADAALESGLSPSKVEPTHHDRQHTQDVLKSYMDLVDDDNSIKNIDACSVGCSLKMPARTVAVSNESKGDKKHRNGANGVDYIGKRVQGTDVSGGELFVIREFEPSEHSGSDDEFGHRRERSWLCKLM